MNDELTRVVEMEHVKMGFIKRIISLFASPTELMKNIKVYPVIFAPYLIALIFGLLSIIPGIPASKIRTEHQSIIFTEQNPGEFNPFEVFTQVDDFGERLMSENLVNMMLAFLLSFAASVGPFFVSALTALAIFVLCKIMKSGVRYGQLFSLYMHIYIISALGSIVSFYSMSATNSIVDITTLAAVFTPNGTIYDADFVIFSQIGIFPIWTLVLSFIGLKVICDFSAVKAGIITAIPFIVTTGISVLSLI